MKRKFTSLISAIVIMMFITTSLPCGFVAMAEEGSDTEGYLENQTEEFAPGNILVGLTDTGDDSTETASAYAVTQNNVNHDLTTLLENGIIDSVDVIMETKPAFAEYAQQSSENVNLFSLPSDNDVDRIALIHIDSEDPADVLDTIELLEDVPGVVFAEPDYIMYPEEVTPNDTYYSQQWDMDRIGAPEAWERFTGSEEVVVGVLDTGIDFAHSDLNDNMWQNPSPGTYSYQKDGNTVYCQNDAQGWNFADDNEQIRGDVSDHGTVVAGTIGAEGNNAQGISGVNMQVSIAALKVTPVDDRTALVSDVVIAIGYAQHYGMDVLNYSFSGYNEMQKGNRETLVTAINSFDGVFVWAAGNHENTNIPKGADDLPNLIAVGGTSQTDDNVFCYGKETVHLGAPGMNVLSTHPGNGYVLVHGTSIATPHVSGAVALLIGCRPDLSPAQVKNLILSSVDVVPQLKDMYISGGRLNIDKMLENAYGNNWSIKTPNLAYDSTQGEMVLTDLKLKDESFRSSGAYVTVAKYNQSNASTPLESVTEYVPVNSDDGIGEYTLTSALNHFNASTEFLKITVSQDELRNNIVLEQSIRPMLFQFSVTN